MRSRPGILRHHATPLRAELVDRLRHHRALELLDDLLLVEILVRSRDTFPLLDRV